MPRTLAGDPGALRAAAARLRDARRTAEDAARRVQDALGTTTGSWTGRAAEAFAVAAVATAARLRAVAVLADAAGPLETYVAVLEAAQAQWDAHFDAAAYGYGTAGHEPATQALSDARDRARAAHERAAAEIEQLGSAARDALAVEQSLRTMSSLAVGTGLGAVGARHDLLREAAAAALDPAARAAAGAGHADVTALGNRLAFVGPAAGQLLSDADNPRFSAAERAGRAAAQGATVGVGAVGGAAAGAALGTLLFPGVGTVAGFALGALGGWGGAVLVDEVNDDAVDRVGEQADDVVPR